jgi:bacteriorhodopsin
MEEASSANAETVGRQDVETADFETTGTEGPAACRQPDSSGEFRVSRIKSMCYVLLCVLNIGPFFAYAPSLSMYGNDSQELETPHWLCSTALGVVFIANMLVLVKISFFKISYMKTAEKIMLVGVPLVTLAAYAVAASSPMTRWLEPTTGRPIFATRYVAWLITVPVLILEGAPLSGLRAFQWIAALTNSYILCAWAAQMSPTPEEKYFWIFVAFATFILTGFETLVVLRELKPPDSTFIQFVGILFAIYGGLYLMSDFDRISVTEEVLLFGATDFISKAFFSWCVIDSSQILAATFGPRP